MADFEGLKQAVINGNLDETKLLVQEALDAGVDANVILNDGLVPGMLVVGEKFKNNEFYVPEVLIAARAMKGGTQILEPHLKDTDQQSAGKVAIGTVQGDLHDIGKNLVAMMFEGAGFEVLDLGVDVSPEKFVNAVQNDGASVIALSALLTTTMTNIARTIEALDSAGVRGQCKVIIGGAPVTQEYADEVGADGYAPDAGSAVDTLKELIAA